MWKCTSLNLIDKLLFVLNTRYKNNSPKYYSNICFLSILSLDTNFLLKSSIKEIISATISSEKPKILSTSNTRLLKMFWAVLKDGKRYEINIQKEKKLMCWETCVRSYRLFSIKNKLHIGGSISFYTNRIKDSRKSLQSNHGLQDISKLKVHHLSINLKLKV